MSPACLSCDVAICPLQCYVVIHIAPIRERVWEDIVCVVCRYIIVIVHILVRNDAVCIVTPVLCVPHPECDWRELEPSAIISGLRHSHTDILAFGAASDHLNREVNSAKRADHKFSSRSCVIRSDDIESVKSEINRQAKVISIVCMVLGVKKLRKGDVKKAVVLALVGLVYSGIILAGMFVDDAVDTKHLEQDIAERNEQLYGED